MARRAVDIRETLFDPVRRLELFRHNEAFLQAYYGIRQTAGARKGELGIILEALREIQLIIQMNHIHPLDDPKPSPAPVLPPQPLVMPGTEQFMHAFIAELAE
jgi:hypothetical protein